MYAPEFFQEQQLIVSNVSEYVRMVGLAILEYRMAWRSIYGNTTSALPLINIDNTGTINNPMAVAVAVRGE